MSANRGDAGRGVELVDFGGAGFWPPGDSVYDATHIAYPKAIALAQMSVVEAGRAMRAEWVDATSDRAIEASRVFAAALDALDQAQRDCGGEAS